MTKTTMAATLAAENQTLDEMTAKHTTMMRLHYEDATAGERELNHQRAKVSMLIGMLCGEPARKRGRPAKAAELSLPMTQKPS